MPNIVTVNVSQTVGPTPATLQQSGALISQGATTTSVGTATLLTQASALTSILVTSKAITLASWVANVATITTTVAHGLTVGTAIYLTVSGVSVSSYNGTWLCTPTTTTAFTFTVIGTSISAGTGGTYLPESAVELQAMVTTFFAQGSSVSCYVLELGIGSVDQGVATLTSYIAANPNSNYTPGAAGYFYAYVVPRTWDSVASFLTLLQSFESNTSKTYFFITTTLATYTNYTALMKCAFTLIESPTFGTYTSSTISTLTYSATTTYVTAVTAAAHGIVPGNWFTITGCTPIAYNGTWLALPGTTGTTLVYAVSANPGTATIFGTVLASLYANTGVVAASEFSIAAPFYIMLGYNPSAANLVTPFCFSYVYGVTPFPVRGNNALLTTLKSAFTNVIGTGAEGGISNTIILWGTTEDGHDLTYWYSVDWVQIVSDEMLANAVINGSNNPQNPLYYDQNGINRLRAVEQTVMNNAIAFGLALGPVTVTAVPFATYVSQNPTDYPAGIYRGLAVSYTPQRGFTQIVFYVNVTSFPAAG